MGRYLMTHSLLASWLYTMKENPYEDMTTERDPMSEFMQTLRRDPTPTTEAMQNGIKFEDMLCQRHRLPGRRPQGARHVRDLTKARGGTSAPGIFLRFERSYHHG